jgi:nitrogen fixation NifU-like protein
MEIEELGLYQEQLLDYYKNPRLRGTIAHPSFSSGEYNPSCGDEVEVYGVIEGNQAKELRFIGQGCVVSQAAVALLLEQAQGKTIQELLSWDKDTVISMVKIPLGPNRLRCALLGLYALQRGLRQYLEQKSDVK